MTLRAEVETILGEGLAANPVWNAVASQPDKKIELEGSVGDVIQASVSALTEFSETLMAAVLRVADAVDEISGEGRAQT